MIPVSLWPTWLGITGCFYAVAAAILALGYLWYTIRFARIIRVAAVPRLANLRPRSAQGLSHLSSSADGRHDARRQRTPALLMTTPRTALPSNELRTPPAIIATIIAVSALASALHLLARLLPCPDRRRRNPASLAAAGQRRPERALDRGAALRATALSARVRSRSTARRCSRPSSSPPSSSSPTL